MGDSWTAEARSVGEGESTVRFALDFPPFFPRVIDCNEHVRTGENFFIKKTSSSSGSSRE